MITRHDIYELAAFESAENNAISFYFQPSTPQNQSHREEAILVKDLVRDALRAREDNGKNGSTRADLEKILQLAEGLRGKHARAKAVFACGASQFWREFDLPPRIPSTRLVVNNRFHLGPLAGMVEALPRICVVLVSRVKARFFELWLDNIRQTDEFEDELPRRGRSDGWAGYDAGHAERHVAHEAMHHFKKVSDRLKELLEGGGFEKLVVGCRDETWAEFEPHLHPYLRQRLLGRFHVDPHVAAAEEVRERAQRILQEENLNRRQGLIREVLGEAQRNGRGAIGLRHVLESLERGEVQSLLLGRNFNAAAVECRNCSHLDTRMVRHCAVCGKETRQLEDVTDALVAIAIRNNIEIVPISDDAEFERAGNVGALLRFRGDQNTSQKKAG